MDTKGVRGANNFGCSATPSGETTLTLVPYGTHYYNTHTLARTSEPMVFQNKGGGGRGGTNKRKQQLLWIDPRLHSPLLSRKKKGNLSEGLGCDILHSILLYTSEQGIPRVGSFLAGRIGLGQVDPTRPDPTGEIEKCSDPTRPEPTREVWNTPSPTRLDQRDFGDLLTPLESTREHPWLRLDARPSQVEIYVCRS